MDEPAGLRKGLGAANSAGKVLAFIVFSGGAAVFASERYRLYIFVVSDGRSFGRASFQVDANITDVSVTDLGTPGVRSIAPSVEGGWKDNVALLEVKVYTATLAQATPDEAGVTTYLVPGSTLKARR